MIEKIDDIIKSENVQKAKRKAKRKVNQTKKWIVDHKEEAIALTYVGITAIASVGKIALRIHQRNCQERDRSHRWYDDSIRQWYILRRKVTNSEMIQITARHRNGESYGEILDDMNLLK